MKSWAGTGLVLAALLTVITSAAGVSAQGKGGKGGGSGSGTTSTIYYVGPWTGVTTGGTAAMWSMNPDGSEQQELGRAQFGPPSTALHGLRRWFVLTQPIPGWTYPDGRTRAEVFAFRDDYNGIDNIAQTRVQLTNDPTLEPAVYSPDWVPGDQMISFKGRRWSSTDPDATVVEGGLYVASLTFAQDGNISGSVASPVRPVLAFALDDSQWPALRSREHGWHPDGRSIVYASGSGIWLADVVTGAHTQVFAGSGARYPQVSPDGTKIAFASGGQSISTIKINGSGLKQLVSATQTMIFYRPYWSPQSDQLAFTGQARRSGSSGYINMDVYVVSANGRSLRNLTNTLDPLSEMPWGWR